jgi:hypothetical protein
MPAGGVYDTLNTDEGYASWGYCAPYWGVVRAPVEEMPVFALPIRLEDGAMEVQLSGRPDRTYVLEASENLEAWIPIATNSAPSGLLIWIDSAATNLTQRFYRARLP